MSVSLSLQLCVAAVCLTLCRSAHAQTPARSLPDLSPFIGKQIEVTTENGTVLGGKLIRASEASLVLETDLQQTNVLVWSQIRTVSHWQSDSVWNGILIGAVVGVGGAAVIAAIPDTDEPMALYTVPPGLLIGMAAGWIGDAARRTKIPIFRATGSQVTVAPIMARGRRGITVTIRF
jgi:hypothetical protein